LANARLPAFHLIAIRRARLCRWLTILAANAQPNLRPFKTKNARQASADGHQYLVFSRQYVTMLFS
jgi:hypothetical protein